MAKAKFDVSQLMNKQSTEEAKRAQAESRTLTIPLDMLDPSPENKYSIEGIEELAASIELVGLLQNPLVRQKPDGRYAIIAGHRRREALKLLVSEGHDEYKDVPCTLIRYDDDVISELQLLMANSTTRIMTDAEKVYQTERIRDLLLGLKRSGYKFGMRMREVVAQMMQTSATNAGRYESIIINLISAWRELFDTHKITVTQAYELSRLEASAQHDALSVYYNTGVISIPGTSAAAQKDETPLESAFVAEALRSFCLHNFNEQYMPQWAITVQSSAEVREHLVRHEGATYSGGTIITSGGDRGYASCSPKGISIERGGKKATLTWAEAASIVYELIEVAAAQGVIERRQREDIEAPDAAEREPQEAQATGAAALVEAGMEHGIQSGAAVEAERAKIPPTIHLVKATYETVLRGGVVYFEEYGSGRRIAARVEVIQQ